MTFNNLACFYRRTGKLRTAHIFLERALAIEQTYKTKVASKADTHLNMCAVLSSLGKHEKAMDHAH